MLMYGKEASKPKTGDGLPVPRYSEPKKLKAQRNVHNWLFRHGQLYSQHMESERAAFPRPANRVTHNAIRQPVIYIPTMPATTESLSFVIPHKIEKFSFCRLDIYRDFYYA